MATPPRDETVDERKTSVPEAATRPEPHLFLALRADAPEEGGARIGLEGASLVSIGRGRGFDIERRLVAGSVEVRVTLPAPALSERHAVLRSRGAFWEVEDLQSRNGTWVDGQRVGRATLVDGALLELGRALFLFRPALPTPGGTPLALRASHLDALPLGFRSLLPTLVAKHEALARLAPSRVPILLLGPTGAGKEVVARAIHEGSGRSGDFVAVNCGALPATLLESLLFGHVKGAFSGATRDEDGFVRAAAAGTLLLDEVGDLPPQAQVALLRMLEQGEVVPVGSTRPVKVDVRVIAATHKPIEELAARGEFRSDLLGRLKGYTHRLLPLAERREDFGLLLAALLSGDDAPPRLDPALARAFLAYDWPLNVRELRQILGVARTLAGGAPITPHHLPDDALAALARRMAAAPAGRATPPSPTLDPEERAQRDALERDLRDAEGNIAEVARRRGKAPIQIRRLLKRFGLELEAFRPRKP